MKPLQNTLENKKAFFAQYWLFIYGEHGVFQSIDDAKKEDWLKLTPLSQITDEDVMNSINNLTNPKQITMDMQKRFFIAIRNPKNMKIGYADYLRSKGYALPWMGISVETLIELGWIKLKQ